jgi:hypothetical protein
MMSGRGAVLAEERQRSTLIVCLLTDRQNGAWPTQAKQTLVIRARRLRQQLFANRCDADAVGIEQMQVEKRRHTCRRIWEIRHAARNETDLRMHDGHTGDPANAAQM